MDDKIKNELINKKRRPLFCVDCKHCTVANKTPTTFSDYCTLKRVYLPGVRGYAENCNYYASNKKEATEALKEYMEKNKDHQLTIIKNLAEEHAQLIEKMFIDELAVLGIKIKDSSGMFTPGFKQDLINRNIGLYQEITPNNSEYYAKDLTTGKILFKWRLEMLTDPFDNKIIETFNKII